MTSIEERLDRIEEVIVALAIINGPQVTSEIPIVGGYSQESIETAHRRVADVAQAIRDERRP